MKLNVDFLKGIGLAMVISGLTILLLPEEGPSEIIKEVEVVKEVEKEVEVVKEVEVIKEVQLTDAQIIERAKKLGMIKAPATSTPNNTNTTISNTSNTTANTKIVNIPGDSSYSVARKLEQEGIIDDSTKFAAYISEQGKASLLQEGKLEFKVGSTYKEALNVLLKEMYR